LAFLNKGMRSKERGQKKPLYLEATSARSKEDITEFIKEKRGGKSLLHDKPIYESDNDSEDRRKGGGEGEKKRVDAPAKRKGEGLRAVRKGRGKREKGRRDSAVYIWNNAFLTVY